MAKKVNKKQKNKPQLKGWGYSKERDYILENIALLISSGIGVSEAVSIVASEIKSKKIKRILAVIIEDLDNGSQLWRTFESSGLFNDNYINLIRVSEQSGRLPESLRMIIAQQQKERSFRNKIRAAMVYPGIISALIIIVGLGVSWFILPKLTTAFSGMKIELPWITKITMEFGNFLQTYGYIFVPAAIIGLFLILYILFINRRTRFLGQNILIRTPIIRDIIKQTEIARFGFIMGGLLDSGLPLVESFDSLIKTSVYKKYTKLYMHLREKIDEGYSFKNSLESYKDSSKLIPVPIQQMIVAGENSGNLPGVLSKINSIYEEKVDIATNNLAVVLEPLLLIVVFSGVLVLALAVVIPIYTLVGNIGG